MEVAVMATSILIICVVKMVGTFFKLASSYYEKNA